MHLFRASAFTEPFFIQSCHAYRSEPGVLQGCPIPRARKGGLSEVNEDAGKNT